MARPKRDDHTTDRDLDTVGGRLAFERNRLKLSLEVFGQRCGVSRLTQLKYENGQHHPDTRYLIGAIELGVDVMYVITGKRNAQQMEPDVQNLVDVYLIAPESFKNAVFGVLAAMYSNEIQSFRHKPGYFMHEVIGNNETRYIQNQESSRGVLQEPTPQYGDKYGTLINALERSDADGAALLLAIANHLIKKSEGEN